MQIDSLTKPNHLQTTRRCNALAVQVLAARSGSLAFQCVNLEQD